MNGVVQNEQWELYGQSRRSTGNRTGSSAVAHVPEAGSYCGPPLQNTVCLSNTDQHLVGPSEEVENKGCHIFHEAGHKRRIPNAPSLCRKQDTSVSQLPLSVPTTG